MGSKPVTTETTGTTKLPDWLTDAVKGAVGGAGTIAGKEYTPYTGANPYGGTSDDSRSAFQGLRDYISGGGGGTKDAITGYMGAGAQKVATKGVFDDGDIDKYLNPYTEKALQPALRKIQESADAARNRLKAGATSSGSFGDARHGVVESNLDANTSQAIGDTSATFMNNAFKDAVATKQADINRQFQADTTNAGFAETALGRKLTGAQAANNQQLGWLRELLGAGQIQEGKDTQAGIWDYGQYTEGRDWGKNNMSWLMSLLAGAPTDKTQTGTSTQTGGPSPWMSLLGGLAQGIGSKI